MQAWPESNVHQNQNNDGNEVLPQDPTQRLASLVVAFSLLWLCFTVAANVFYFIFDGY